MSIPTLMAIRDGVVVFQQPGALPEPALESLISQVRGSTWTRFGPSPPPDAPTAGHRREGPGIVRTPV